MASVMDVAKYILHKTGRISTMKLQKLVYYSKAWSLVWDGDPLFPEAIEAWANGPVCPELFYAHKGVFLIDENDISGDISVFSKDQKATMNAIVRDYGEKTASELSDLTHSEAPWIDARKGIFPGDPCRNKITDGAMFSYYGSL